MKLKLQDKNSSVELSDAAFAVEFNQPFLLSISESFWLISACFCLMSSLTLVKLLE